MPHLTSLAVFREAASEAATHDTMHWDGHDIVDLRDMLCKPRKLLNVLDLALSDVLDTTRIPSAPHPKHGYTHLIWAVDEKGWALVGPDADQIMSSSEIMASAAYRKAAAIHTNIAGWNGQCCAELRAQFRAVRKMSAIKNLTAFDIVDPGLLPHPECLEYLKYYPEYRIWAVDRHDNVLVGDDADKIKTYDEVVIDGMLAEVAHISRGIMEWSTDDVRELHFWLQQLDEILSDEALSSHPTYGRRDVFVDLASLPSAKIPAGLPTEYLWAIDRAGNALVGARADQIMTVALWRRMHGTLH